MQGLGDGIGMRGLGATEGRGIIREVRLLDGKGGFLLTL